MPEFIEILIISVLQGIGEFLPISSSGHNAVANTLFTRYGVPLTEDSADFIKLNVLLHIGSLFAVLIVFRQRVFDLFTKDQRLIPLLIVGTLPAVVVGLTVKKTCPWIGDNMLITGLCFAVTGILLLWTLRSPEGEKTCSTMSFLDALVIGCVQAIAILPGISRSGSTIVAGLFCKLRRDEAATFSFLLAIPVIGGGGILELKDLLKPDELESGSALPLWLLLVGAFISFLVGIAALLWVIDWLKKGKLWYFAVWVFLMCPFTLWLAATPHSAATPSPNSAESTIDLLHNPCGHAQKTSSCPQITQIFTDFWWKYQNSETNLCNLWMKIIDGLGNATSPIEEQADEEAIEEDESPSRLEMTREEALREYEKMRAEEEARELALIEEEKKRIPLVDAPETLIPLDSDDRIWLTKDGKSVVLLGRVALREGLLELFACRIRTKEHESIVSVRVKPWLIHAALLGIGAEPGKPVQMHPEFVPPSGDEIEIKVRWLDSEGIERESLAQDWVLDNAKSTEDDPQAMSTHWVFTGSMEYVTEEGVRYYIADETGELFGLSNFVGAILDVPIQSTDANHDLLFSCFTERIPEVGTPLTLILTPVKNKR